MNERHCVCKRKRKIAGKSNNAAQKKAWIVSEVQINCLDERKAGKRQLKVERHVYVRGAWLVELTSMMRRRKAMIRAEGKEELAVK